MKGWRNDWKEHDGIAANTIVIYGTDNGAEVMSWPDGGTTPFRGEKANGFEGACRTPCLIRWPGVIKPGTIYDDFFAHEDFLPTFCAAAGDPDVVAKCAKGHSLGAKTFKVYLDGYNLIPLGGFWSLSIYNEHHFFVANTISRFSVGTQKKDLKLAGISLYVSAYWPKPAVTDESWTLPAVEKVKS